ncbi:MAG: LPS export ABC transporter periplasmic protein LptC [Brevundimonas sp.]|uniref:LPS export ABC transporter periplasmic protein LptC n=1 Tax=Brevundimonas sp. TaxID=1871086 RepID=UPI00271CEFD0|nr:LPS export ABC transporter periplasmic protein LptC [Brevundimonas sp.]MDO9589422.1 LPS export ABC transporter periplasmic protein LptC [Brevundimonas sp.]MDP3370406.1 LPS export ABC transporter periplasmic protein LptC [Brevundimonas sp.]MDP3657576.1 LPS export ABC transporter periplasmic protein LptC [Brevundimonas sp.]MDZ4114192.1 LPS export ABC transporter periplasmic protein LptC [Brevundimonas sp.]
MTDPADTHAQEDEARVAATARAFRARSRRVHLLRRVLPVAIVVLAGGSLSWIVLRSVMSDVERKAGTSNEIRLDAAMFHGQDAEGRSFVVGARSAIRDPETGRFRLEGPALRLNLGGRKVTTLTADGGVYDETARTVTIGPNVRISDGGSGFSLVTPEAVVDTATGVVTGSKGVQGAGPLGTVNASSYVIYEQGERVVFRGAGDNKVRGTINPAGSDR